MSAESSPQQLPTVESLLRDVGDTDGSGVLEVGHPDGSSSYIWVREGRIYALQVPGYRPALGIRLLSGGLVSPEQLSAAAVEQRERRPGQLIGEVLVGMGLVSPEVIDNFLREQVLDQAADLLDLEVAAAEFHSGRHIRQGLSEAVDPEDLLAAARECHAQRGQILTQIGGRDVVPMLGPPTGRAADAPLGPYDWSVLCRVDGTRDLTELARVCGFTVVETAQIVADLAATGLLALPDPEPGMEPVLAPVVALPTQVEPAAPEWSFAGTDVGEPDPVPPGGTDDQVRSELLSEFGALLRDDPVEAPVRSPATPEPGVPEEGLEGAAEPLPEAGSARPTAAVAGEVPPAVNTTAPLPTARPDAGGEQLDAPTPAAQAGLPLEEPPLLTLVNPGASQPAVTSEPPGASDPPDSPMRPAPPGSAAPESPLRAGPESVADDAADTTAFMRELSSLSDDPDEAGPVVTRLVVPFTAQRRKRRFWGR